MDGKTYYLNPRLAFRRIGQTTYILPVRADKPLRLLRGWGQMIWDDLVKLPLVSLEGLLPAVRPGSVSPERLKKDLDVFLKALVDDDLLIPQGRALGDDVPLRPGDYTALWNVAEQALVPLKADLELTYRCNLRCKYCYVSGGRSMGGLSSQRLVDLLDELAGLGCLFLAFTGGEPLMRPDLLDLVREAGRRRFAIRILTNGTRLTESTALALYDIGRVMVEVSIHGSTPDRHDAFTQRRGSFYAARRGVKLLRAARIPTVLKLSITRLNADDVGGIRRVAKEWGVPLVASPLVFPSVLGEQGITDYRVDDEQLGALMKQGEYTPRTLRCSAGRAKVWIAPDGDVFPCEFARLSMGNVAQGTFASVWEGEAIKEFRADMPFVSTACRQCRHRSYCPYCPGIAWLEHGSLTVPSSEACRICRVWASVNEKNPMRIPADISPGKVQLTGREEADRDKEVIHDGGNPDHRVSYGGRL